MGGTWGEPAFEAAPLAWLIGWMRTFHIQGFTLISGYVFYHVKFSGGKYREYSSFLLNKAKRLLIPYIFVAALWVVTFEFLFSEAAFSNIRVIIKNYVFGISPSQLWFLLMLFDVFMIIWPLSDYLRKHNVLGAALIVSLNIVGLIGETIIPDFFQIWRACKFSLYFWMGMKLCQYIKEYGGKPFKKHLVWSTLIAYLSIYAVAGLIPKSGLFLKLLVKGLDLLLTTIGALVAFAVLGRLSEIVPWKGNRAFSLLSKYSFPMYLFHQQLVYCGIRLFDGLINPYLHAVVNILIAVIGSLLISWVLMRFKVTRILIGEKE